MIPFVDLPAQYRALKPEIDAAVAKVFENAQFILGPAVAAFERDFAAFCGASEESASTAVRARCISRCSRPASDLVTKSSRFRSRRGDGCRDIEYAGAKPVLVDVEPEFLTMDPGKLEAATTVFMTGTNTVRWTFGRELLCEGLYEPSGDGDVHVWPCLDSDGRAVVIIEPAPPTARRSSRPRPAT